MKDKELAIRAYKGDEKAFKELYDKYEPSIRSIFNRNVNNKSDIDDLVMLAIIKIYRNIDKYDGRVQFNTWATQVTYNILLDYFRQKRRRYRVIKSINNDDLNYIDNLSSDNTNPEESTIISQNAEKIKEVMKELKEYQRKVLSLRFFKHLSYEEIAKELNIPLGTIKAQIFRAKEVLLEKLKKDTE